MDPVSRLTPSPVHDLEPAAEAVAPAAVVSLKNTVTVAPASLMNGAQVPGIPEALQHLFRELSAKQSLQPAGPPRELSRVTPQPAHDNHFAIDLSENTPGAAGGILEQSKQLALTVGFTGLAADRLVTSGKPVLTDLDAKVVLLSLERSAPLSNEPVSTATYTSVAKGSPREAYDRFVKDPQALFAASGIEMVPPVKELKNGSRVFLLESGTPPVLAPIEVRTDPAKLRIEITTLAGHPLRGTNAFQFSPEGEGTRVVQESKFQGSSLAVYPGIHLLHALDRQHEIWRNTHAHLAETK